MANSKISALTSASTPLAGTEVLPIVQSGATVKATVANITGAGAYPGYFTALRSYRSGVDQSVQVSVSGGESFIAAVNGANASEMPLYFQVQNTGLALTSVASVASTGFRVITGNVTIATAAKGVNFTANTPLAGMTSQLLNWYEEGTWTPTISATSGAITTSSSSSAFYTRVGSVVSFTVVLTITNNGTGAGQLRFTIPFNGSRGYANAVGTNASSGATVQGTSSSSSPSSIDMNKVDGTYPVSSGQSLRISGTYII